ncbi:MlaA family lipoprotein [Holospora curviuscula]|uniref:Putative phospholipid-binding lipoprotein MlaA n=1 Tax=Holospora curviuscula TaxID=1082868 RepID=A0A2S5R953_9PROT|nr:VacJ family lipoprotein [Holospora curviuscula]PPE03732.1 putative phospholipid-binding lipoprotein MlaA precursor [Holospora curviuscula]
MIKIKHCILVGFIIFLGGCSENQSEVLMTTQQRKPTVPPKEKKKKIKEKDVIWDPLEPWNRGVFIFNQAIEHVIWEPILTVYKTLIPSYGQTAVHNVLQHVKMPINIISLGLQGEGERALSQFARFICNTLFGLGGIIDIANDIHLEAESEDISSLLKAYNVPTGCFMILPFLGPTVSRDAFGKLCMSGVYAWISPLALVSYGLFGIENLNQRIIFKDSIDHVMEFSADPYAVIRRAYYEARGEFPDSFEEEAAENEEEDGENE